MRFIVLFILTISCSFLSCKKETQTIHENQVDESIVQEVVSQEELNFVMGKFEPSTDDRFELIDKAYADREGMYIQKETFAQFKKMQAAASKDGIQFVIRSATRNFDYQKGIWERKWNGETTLENNKKGTDYENEKERALKILEYSSMPGTSRHHWGTDIDLNSFDNDWFGTGEGLKLYDWMIRNAHEYGFCQPYTAKGADRPYGYNEEKWHWSYTPLSEKYTEIAEKHLKNEMIQGAKGTNVAAEIDVKNRYILGVNHSCL